MKRVILQEDDCAPDAREYFNKDLKRLTGLSVGEMINISTLERPDELTFQYIYADNFCLEYCGDDPFWKYGEL